MESHINKNFVKSTILTQTHICHIVTRNFLSLKKYFVKSSLVIHLVKTLLSRNFCQKSVRENFHTLYSHSVMLHRLISRKFRKKWARTLLKFPHCAAKARVDKSCKWKYFVKTNLWDKFLALLWKQIPNFRNFREIDSIVVHNSSAK